MPVKKKATAKKAPPGLLYLNAAGKTVRDTTGKLDPEKLYYVQPNGSYERGGDRRTLGRIKPPTARKSATTRFVESRCSKKPAKARTHG